MLLDQKIFFKSIKIDVIEKYRDICRFSIQKSINIDVSSSIGQQTLVSSVFDQTLEKNRSFRCA